MVVAHGWGTKLAQFHMSRSNIRYALKTALSALIVWWSLGLMGVASPVFALISVVVVAEPQLGASLFLAWSRVLATVIGVAAALVMVVVIGVNPWALAVAILTVMLLCTEIFEVPGAWKLGPVTSVLIIGLAAAGGHEHTGFADVWPIALRRFWETIYGIAVTVAVSRLVWPEWSHERLKGAAAQYCGANARRIERIVRILAGESGGERESERMAIVAAMRQFEATASDARHERLSGHAAGQTTAVLPAGRAFADSCVVVERLASHLAEGLPGHDMRAATVEVLGTMRERLDRLARGLGGSQTDPTQERFRLAYQRLGGEVDEVRKDVGQEGRAVLALAGEFAFAEAVLRASGDLEALARALEAAMPARV
ncbi:MAG: FUSC family protein [Alphaproteobacteria bacterium]